MRSTSILITISLILLIIVLSMNIVIPVMSMYDDHKRAEYGLWFDENAYHAGCEEVELEGLLEKASFCGYNFKDCENPEWSYFKDRWECTDSQEKGTKKEESKW